MSLKHVHDTVTTLVAPAARQGGTSERPLGRDPPRLRAPTRTSPPLLLTRTGI
jgi:hypothetical protein